MSPDSQLMRFPQTADTVSLAETLARDALAIASYAALGVLLLIIGFYVIDLATPGKLSRLIKTDRNPNATLLASSGLAAVGLIVAASIWSSGGALHEGLLATLVYGLVGIAVQTVAMVVFDLAAGISVRKLVSEPELQPGTRLLAVTHLALGLITAVAVI
ncbi:DUF350 domain-containing protein [Planobispora rosea]|uniref:DUF350 domain-containing protein n=1 Tax=Planobispora rosea TaxID=35762 RepID=A0A8J3S3C4_PLARO|nr:DUF350 domain-containing protein [Planobispora rosea]GGS66952.1 DUF350 domain-containing protein [Planobispora rosea]GIH85092.1 DUF350 domain-containing protein [Planobispora rosea]